MEHMQKVTNINHIKFDIHTLDNMEVTRTFMFNLHIQTILAKIMWDKLAECTASTIDQFFTWKPTFFGPYPTFPPPTCNVARRERLPDESSNIASGRKGGASEYYSNSGKRHFVPHILARIVAWWESAEFKYPKNKMCKTNSYFENFEYPVNLIYTVCAMLEMMS